MGRGPEGAARLGWDLVGSWELVGSPRRKYPGARGLGGFGIRAGRCMVGCNRNMRLDSKVYLKKKISANPKFLFHIYFTNSYMGNLYGNAIFFLIPHRL